jgi:hypothetical protein
MNLILSPKNLDSLFFLLIRRAKWSPVITCVGITVFKGSATSRICGNRWFTYALSRERTYFCGKQICCVAMDVYSCKAWEGFFSSRCLANGQMRHNVLPNFF